MSDAVHGRTNPDDQGSGGRGFLWLMLAAALFYSIFILRTGFLVGDLWYFTLFDDAMISMRYARNLAEGFGPVWNPGQPPVEGYTNLLWMLAMAGIHRLPLSDAHTSLAVMVLGALILLAGIWTVRRIAERITGNRRGPALVAAALVAFYYPLVFWTLRGMEVGALALLLSVSVLLLLRLRERSSTGDVLALGAATAAAILTRSDAIVPALVIAFFALTLMPGRRGLAASLSVLLAAGAALAAHTAFRQRYYGDPLPNTYYLKITGVALAERVGRGAEALVDLMSEHLLLPLLIAALGLIALPAAWRMFQLLLIAVVLGQCTYSVYVGGDVWESMGGANRFICVAMPLLWVAVAVAVDALLPQAERAPDPRRVRRWAVRLGFVGGLVLLAAAAFQVFAVGEWRTRGHAVRGEQIALTGLAASAGLVLWWWAVHLMPARRAAAVERTLIRLRPHGGVLCAALAVLLWTLTCGTPLRYWMVANAKTFYDDVDHTVLGVMIRRHTDPECTVAMSWAGAIAYFSRRSAIDTLGKNDRVVSRMEPVRRFTPGHNKENLGYSIDELRPDVVYLGGAKDVPSDFGYDSLGNDVWVRNDSTHVERSRLSRRWRRLSHEATRELWRTQAEIRAAGRQTGLFRQWLTRWLRTLRSTEPR